ncbi:MAG: phosphatidylserine decarboxylase, partial [Akkermansia sp.]|nr:phosphatidylserine decarboxylase [Akkermansia sp.]
MSTEPIRFYNRYTGEIEQEKILGEKYLRWIYGTTLGRAGLHVLVKRAIFSKLLGAMKNSRKSAETIPAFIEEYGINTEELEKPLEEFT